MGGAALALANELADDERDRAARQSGRPSGRWAASGRGGPARCSRRWSPVVALVSLVVDGAPTLALGAADGSVALIMIGLALGRSPRAGTRERGWEAQAIGLGGLAIAWLGGLASRGHLRLSAGGPWLR